MCKVKQSLLGKPTNPHTPVDATAKPLFGPTGTAQTWQSEQDSITVTYLNNKATHWVGMIDGQALGPVDDPMYALKGTPPPGPKVSLANYNGIAPGTSFQALTQFFGPPSSQTQPRTTPVTKASAHAHDDF